MNQEKITQFLQGNAIDCEQEVSDLFKEIQLLVVHHHGDKAKVIEEIERKYHFEHHFCGMVVLCATLYIN